MNSEKWLLPSYALLLALFTGVNLTSGYSTIPLFIKWGGGKGQGATGNDLLPYFYGSDADLTVVSDQSGQATLQKTKIHMHYTLGIGGKCG